MDLAKFSPSPSSFGRRGAVVTPSDDADLPAVVKAVVCLTAGNVSVIPADNSTPISFIDVGAGFVVPYQVRRVRATGTTCAVATVEG